MTRSQAPRKNTRHADAADKIKVRSVRRRGSDDCVSRGERMKRPKSASTIDHYGAQYGNFASELYAEIRREAFGEDIGQTGWLTAGEQNLFIAWLDLSASTHLLDLACGSGRPTLRIAQITGCRVSGVDLHDEAVTNAIANAKELGLEADADFQQGNAAERLPFEDSSFDAITCVDAINHLPNRPKVLEEWHRVLKPGGRLLFTDPIVLTGPISNEEIAIRASIGFFLFVPRGVDEALLKQAGFKVELYAEIRREAFGEDIGQTGWLTAGEQNLFIAWLDLSASTHLLDLACGSGRPTLRIAQITGCRVSGVDLHDEAVTNAIANAKELGLEADADFQQGNAAERLPFEDSSFDAITCVDAINHLPNRPKVLEEWHRVLKPGGRLLFTDPIVLTGPISNEEIAIRASIGFFLFVPRGVDEALLKQAGFKVECVEDRTQNMAENAAGRLRARAKRESDLRVIEGDDVFDGQQTFLETAAILAKERRLSRLAILATRNP